MGQLHPTGGLNLDSKVIRLAYQAINDEKMRAGFAGGS